MSAYSPGPPVAAQGGSADRGPLIPPPSEKAPARVVVTMILARFGVMAALATPLSAGLTLKLQELVAAQDVVATLGIITSLGAFSALFFDPIFGRLSDRTTSRFGRRRPWMIIGAVGLLLALGLIGAAPNVVVVGIGWVLAQMIGNAAVGAHTATLADQLTPLQRGKVSGATGVAQQAAFLGAAYAAQLLNSNMLLLFLVPGILGLLLIALYAAVLPDERLPRKPEGRLGLLMLLTTFWVNPLKNPDFGLAWWSRFLLVLANFMFVTYRLLWIQHEFGLTPARATEVMATGVLAYTIALIVSGQVAGWLSDVVKRRKPFIIGSAILFALGIYLLTHTSDPSGFYAAEVVLGIGFGTYVAVDLALVVDILPDPDEAAKDLGVFNIAMAGPQVLAPGVAALVISNGGAGGYDTMLILAAVIALVGAFLILPIKKVK